MLAELAALPPAQRPEAVLGLIARVIANCSPEVIAEIRAEVVRTFDTQMPVVSDVLDVIDGHLALRDALAE
jgi:hypothetical protein